MTISLVGYRNEFKDIVFSELNNKSFILRLGGRGGGGVNIILQLLLFFNALIS